MHMYMYLCIYSTAGINCNVAYFFDPSRTEDSFLFWIVLAGKFVTQVDKLVGIAELLVTMSLRVFG